MRYKIIIIFSILLLTIAIANAEIIWDEADSTFTIIVNYPVCSDSGEFFTDYRINPPSILPTIGDSPPADCYNPDAEEGDRMCCPPGAECRSTSMINPDGKVIWNCFVTGINFCWDYKDSNSCNNDTANVGERTVEELFGIKDGQELKWWVNASGKNCVDVARNFRCYWDSTNSFCNPRYNNETICEGDADFHEPNDICIIENLNKIDNCNTTGFLDVSWDAHWDISGGQTEDCGPGNASIPCEGMTRLIFFTAINIAAVVVILVVVYYFWFIKTSKTGKKIKKKK